MTEIRLPINQILNGDCLEVLKGLPDESVDAVTTDPPYGLGTREPTGEDIEHYLRGESLDTGGDFMGKEWEIPPVAVWRECYRVLKPGGHLGAFAGTRTWDLMSMGIRAAGFVKRDTIASFFGNLSMLAWVHCLSEDTEVFVDGHWVSYGEVREGAKALCYDVNTGSFRWLRIQKRYVYLYDGDVFALRGPRTDQLVTPGHRCLVWDGKAYVFKLAEQLAAEERTPVVDVRSASSVGSGPAMAGVQFEPTLHATRTRSQPDLVRVTREPYRGIVWCIQVPTGAFVARRNGKAFITGNSQGFPKSHNVFKTDIVPMVEEALVEKGCTKPFKWKHDLETMVASETPEIIEVKLFDIPFQIMRHREGEYELPYDLVKWKGYGTALKPSFEPILVFRKPFEGTMAETVVSGGDGPINVDGSRVKHSSPEDMAAHKAMVDAIKNRGGSMANSWKNTSDLSGASDVSVAGRWPPNVIVLHSSECKQVGTKKVDAPVINQFDEGMKPFGNAKGEKYTSKQTGDAEGKEEVAVWECVDGCPVKLLNGQSDTKFDKGDVAKIFPQFQVPDAPFFYTGKATRREKNTGVAEKTLAGFMKLREDLTEEQIEQAESWEGLVEGAIPEGNIPEQLKTLFEPMKGDLGNVHPCLHPDALVLTDGGFRPISTVEVGSRVYAADGTFRPVTDVSRHRYTSPNLIEIRILPDRSLPIGREDYVWASDNHPFLICRPLRNGEEVDDLNPNVLWLQADEVREGDFTMTPSEGCPEHAAFKDQPLIQYQGRSYAIVCVKEVKRVPYVGDVWNLSVEGNPTFQTSIGMSHNTVKPLKLMEWLVGLLCPAGGVVLDPYCGSGTTCLAAVNKGMRFVGIERDPVYHDIAQKRVLPALEEKRAADEQKAVFDLMAELEQE